MMTAARLASEKTACEIKQGIDTLQTRLYYDAGNQIERAKKERALSIYLDALEIIKSRTR